MKFSEYYGKMVTTVEDGIRLEVADLTLPEAQKKMVLNLLLEELDNIVEEKFNDEFEAYQEYLGDCARER